MITSISRPALIALCVEYGSKLQELPVGIIGKQLLWALAGNESSFGADTIPRHEPAFDKGGYYADKPPMPDLLLRYGSPAACSYGPWQILYANCWMLTNPLAMMDSPEICAQCTVDQLNKFMRYSHPVSLIEIGMLWNAGHIMMAMTAGVARYTQELQKNYMEPMK